LLVGEGEVHGAEYRARQNPGVRRVLLALLVLAAACGGDDDGGGGAAATSTTTTTVVDPAELVEGLCAATPVPGRVRVADAQVNELSGLATVGDRLWAHNDSGDEPRVFAIDPATGEVPEVVPVPGATAIDWEDMAAVDGELFVGDIGDNAAQRESISVYRFGLPPGDVQAITVRYPSGPRDAEALLVDPRTRDLVIVHKTFGGPAEVYRAPESDWSDGDVTLEPVGTVAVGNTPLDAVTAGDVGFGGQVVGLRTYGRVLLWPREADQTVADALVENPPCEAPAAVETQGESLALTADGYVTASEGARPVLHRFAAS
jgi:hypothetical protein